MAGLKKHIGFVIWFFLLAFYLTQCENDSFPIKREIDYTGQRGTISDINSNLYKTVGIGTQLWMAQNLRTSRLNDGKKINCVSDNTQWKSLTQPGYSWYNNDSISNERYGVLYNFFTVETGVLCPTGWHVPSRKDWTILINFLGGEDVAAEKMKAYYSRFWYAPANTFSNPPGFSAIPGGFRSSISKRQFTSIDTAGYWWNSNSDRDSGYYSIILKSLSTAIHSSYLSKQDGLSIRCIKD
jgi:uncharacterized protein (TIGR02145 family)